MKNQKGVVLIVTFLITMIIVGIVLGVNAILFNKIKLIGDIGKYVPAYYLADSGTEKAEYYDRKFSGRICSGIDNCPNDAANPGGGLNNCNDVTKTGSDCGTCGNCVVSWNSTDGDRKNTVSVIIACPDPNLGINSTGIYKGVSRQIWVKKAPNPSGPIPCTTQT